MREPAPMRGDDARTHAAGPRREVGSGGGPGVAAPVDGPGWDAIPPGPIARENAPDRRPARPPEGLPLDQPQPIGALLARPQMWGFVATTASIEFCRGALFMALLPAYLPARLGFSVAAVGLVISAQYLADGLFKIPAGWLVDRIGPWRVLLSFLGFSALAVYLLPHAHSLWAYVLLALLFGFGTSANWPAVLAGSVHLSGLASRASATSVTFLAWLAGGGLGPVLISFLVGRDSYRLAFAVLAGVVTLAPLAALIGWSGALRDPRDPAWSARIREESPEDTVAALRANLRRSSWLIPGMFVQMLALGMLIPVLVPFTRQILHLSQSQYGLLLLAGGSVTVLLLLPVGRLVDHVGSKTPLVIGFLLAGLAILLVGHGGSEVGMLWRVGVLGLSYAFILPAWNSLTVGKIAEDRRGLLLGVFMAIEGFGQAIGPALGGWLYTHVGFRVPFQVVAAVMLIMLVFYLVMPARYFAAHGGKAIAR